MTPGQITIAYRRSWSLPLPELERLCRTAGTGFAGVAGPSIVAALLPLAICFSLHMMSYSALNGRDVSDVGSDGRWAPDAAGVEAAWCWLAQTASGWKAASGKVSRYSRLMGGNCSCSASEAEVAPEEVVLMDAARVARSVSVVSDSDCRLDGGSSCCCGGGVVVGVGGAACC